MTRPQTLLLTLLGRHVQRRSIAVSASTFIAALDRLDVSVDAARSTLVRMVRRGFLERHRRGREAYFSLTRDTERVLAEREARIFEPPVRTGGDGRWTLLSFSIPEQQRSDRHHLRVALTCRGFGRLRDGLWIAPGEVDVGGLVERGLSGRIDVFVGRAAPPTDLARVVAEAWDLDAVRRGYEGFVDRWRGDPPEGADGGLAVQIRLLTEWQQLLVDDPSLPGRELPDDWPATRAHQLFRERHDEVSDVAANEFASLLQSIELPDREAPHPRARSDAG